MSAVGATPMPDSTLQACDEDRVVAADHFVVDQRDDVFVEDMLLLVGQILEALERFFERGVVEIVAERFQLVLEGVAAGKLAQHQRGVLHADIFGAHDLIGLDILQHAVLMDAAFMREGVLADDGLVVLHGKAGDVRHQLGGARQHGRRPCRCGTACWSPRTFSAITISSSAALPARSPMPLMVHSIWRAPPSTPASELATAMPRSLWQWVEKIALSVLGTRFLQHADDARYIPAAWNSPPYREY